ncbi:CoA transferase [Iamia sp. SCSIO 61187]|uniref:CoA transferase n=1 Tax=Iamia sp. SCSIO 61187 TaxID=2722752 RepID=UPI001C63B333|nr:CoA transferase [Iamia sp. SCSIO 61187]QYG93222.1 CoA transferase [Iamia sp. SCSIO 61187]
MAGDGPRVLALSSGIPGGYAALLLHEAGAEVVHVEPVGGDPFRSWTQGPEPVDGCGPLFEYLRQGQAAVAPESPLDAEAMAGFGADVVLASPVGDERAVVEELAAREPGLVVVAITPYGLHGPDRDRPATDFTLQADSGALAVRGAADEEPIQMGGRTSEWLAGTYAAAVALCCWRGRRAGGPGGLVDLSLAEVANLGASNYLDVFHAVQSGAEAEPVGPVRNREIPSIERTADGWIGFNTNAPHQIDGFLRMIGRDDLADSGEYMLIGQRLARAEEWHEVVAGWMGERTSAEILALAVERRVPVAPVCDGRTVTELDHTAARSSFVDLASGRGRAPRRPWLIDGEPAPPPGPAPAPPSTAASPPTWRTPSRAPEVTRPDLAGRPLDGLRVLDLTAWWAGPAATALLAALGADVIHVEGPDRMDGIRMVGASFADRDRWWELSNYFLTVNLAKRGLVLDLGRERGRELALGLVEHVDVVVENFTPRVLDKLGLGWDAIRAANPRAILVRMPAYGLDGPWADRPGFAQNMEQASGLAWLTGHLDGPPRIQRGPCDPNGGLHAVVATLAALAERDRTGVGAHVESAMFDSALAVAAEPVLEWTAHGIVLQRDGNRSPGAAPQGLYPTDAEDAWLAVSVETDEQWRALATVLDGGTPGLAADPALADHRGRAVAHDRIDEVIRAWAAPRSVEAAVSELVAVGVPAAPTRDPRLVPRHPQLRARGYHETVDHPVAGPLPLPTQPFRLTGVERWAHRPAPCFGEHTEEILRELLGLDAAEIDRLRADGTIADRPVGT